MKDCGAAKSLSHECSSSRDKSGLQTHPALSAMLPDSIFCRTTVFVVRQIKEAGHGLVLFILLRRDHLSHNWGIVRRGRVLECNIRDAAVQGMQKEPM